MILAPGIRLIRIPEDSPGRVFSTNIYLIGEGDQLMLDAGEESARHAQALFQYFREQQSEPRITQAVISHSHVGHYGGVRWVRQSIGPRFLAHPEALRTFEKQAGKDGAAALKDGQLLRAGGMRLQVVFTPGHSPDSVCLFHGRSRSLFSADTILGGSSTTVSDLGDYMASLERLLALRPRTIYPAHGDVIPDGTAAIRRYIAHRREREDQIIAQLRRRPRTAQRLVELIYRDVDPRLHRAARGNVRQHLLKLQREGRVEAQGSGARARWRWTA